MAHGHHHDHGDHHHGDEHAHVHAPSLAPSLPLTHAVMPLTPLVMSAPARLLVSGVIIAVLWALFFWAVQ